MRLIIIIALFIGLFFGWQKWEEHNCIKKKEKALALLGNISDSHGYLPGKIGQYKGREITVGSFFRSPITPNVFYISIKLNNETQKRKTEPPKPTPNTYLYSGRDGWEIWYNDSDITEWNDATFIKIYDELVKAAKIVEGIE